MGTRVAQTVLVLVLAGLGVVLALSTSRTDAAARTCFGRVVTIVAEAGEQTVGTSGADVIRGTSGDDVIFGRGGADRICSLGGDDVVLGGRGNDRINLGPGDDQADGEKGSDLVIGKGGDDGLWGGPGNDEVRGGSGRDFVHGGPGADVLEGGKGADSLWGKGGKDTLEGGGGDDALFGGGKADRIAGNAGWDLLRGGKGPDDLRGGKGKDICYGDGGVDDLASCENVWVPGLWEVGFSIKAGRYRADGLAGCTWNRFDDIRARDRDFIAGWTHDFAGPMIADIERSDQGFWFSAECGRLHEYHPPPQPATVIVPGVHVVGADIEPGIYRVDVTGNCYWERRTAMSADTDEIIAAGTRSPGDFVFLELDNAGEIFANECGTWQKVEPGFDNCPGIDNPDQSDRYGSPKGDACEDDSDGDGTLDIREPYICVHINGVQRIRRGFVTCDSTPTTGAEANIAIAHAEDASAYADDGNNNTALALGPADRASAGGGEGNTAIADGRGDYSEVDLSGGPGHSLAFARNGNDNTARATGISSHAEAGGGAGGTGNGNAAIADGYDSNAGAYGGDNNRAEAKGTFAFARAGDGSDNTASATGSTRAFATQGDSNTAIAIGPNERGHPSGPATAEAGNGTGNYACADDRDEVAQNIDLCTP